MTRDSNTEEKDTGVVGVIGIAIVICSLTWGFAQIQEMKYQQSIINNQEERIKDLQFQLTETQGKLSGYRENRR